MHGMESMANPVYGRPGRGEQELAGVAGSLLKTECYPASNGGTIEKREVTTEAMLGQTQYRLQVLVRPLSNSNESQDSNGR